MKKVFLVGALVLFGAVNAQMEKGSWIVSGKTGIDFSSVNTTYKNGGQSTDGPKVRTFSITPSVGYFAVQNLSIGLDLGFTSTKTTYQNSQFDANYEQKNSQFTLMPTATYYFPTGSMFRPYLGAGIGYGSLTQTENFYGNKNSNDGLVWGAKGGFVYLLNSTVGLDLGVAYNNFTVNEEVQGTEYKTIADGIGVSAGVSLFFK